MDKLTKIADTLLDEARRLGADYAQCTVSETEKKEFNVDGGEFSLLRTLFGRSVSLTLLKDHRLGTVSLNRFDDAALRQAAADCVAGTASAAPDEAYTFAEGPIERDFLQGSPEPDAEALFDRTREFMADVKERHPRILMEQLITDHSRTEKVFRSTSNVTYRTLSGAYQLMMTYSAHKGKDSTSMYGGGTLLEDLKTPFIDLPLVDREMGDVERQLGAAPVDGKFTGTAVFAPWCLAGDVFGNILENFASDAALIDGTSPWKDKLGAPVADPRLTLSLAPGDPRLVLGQRYTGEGDLAEDFPVIRNGVLESFCLSRYGAGKTGLPRGGNTSSALVAAPGDQSLEEILAGIDKGILLMRFSGGHPAASGEFSGVAKNAFLIENGRLTRPLTETMISGNLADMLLRLRGVSRETFCEGSVVMPYMAFNGITVSGK